MPDSVTKNMAPSRPRTSPMAGFWDRSPVAVLRRRRAATKSLRLVSVGVQRTESFLQPSSQEMLKEPRSCGGNNLIVSNVDHRHVGG